MEFAVKLISVSDHCFLYYPKVKHTCFNFRRTKKCSPGVLCHKFLQFTEVSTSFPFTEVFYPGVKHNIFGVRCTSNVCAESVIFYPWVEHGICHLLPWGRTGNIRICYVLPSVSVARAGGDFFQYACRWRE